MKQIRGIPVSVEFNCVRIETTHQFCALAVHLQSQDGMERPIETPAQFLLTRGQMFREFGQTPKRLMTPRQCYYNSYRLAKRRKGLRYAEGFAASVIPVEHAWCVDEDGRIVDPTWGDKYAPADYFGMTFDLDVVRQIRIRIKKYSVLWSFENWPEAYSLLKGSA